MVLCVAYGCGGPQAVPKSQYTGLSAGERERLAFEMEDTAGARRAWGWVAIVAGLAGAASGVYWIAKLESANLSGDYAIPFMVGCVVDVAIIGWGAWGVGSASQLEEEALQLRLIGRRPEEASTGTPSVLFSPVGTTLRVVASFRCPLPMAYQRAGEAGVHVSPGASVSVVSVMPPWLQVRFENGFVAWVPVECLGP